MTKRIEIVYGFSPDYRFDSLTFDDEAAEIAYKAIFDAEAKMAIETRFEIDGREYWLRTDKYLFWSYGEVGLTSPF